MTETEDERATGTQLLDRAVAVLKLLGEAGEGGARATGIAEAIGRSAGARMLVTGEVVGQVASQTLENMTLINEVATQPVLRPLIGMDKEEITAQAQALGTYPVSIIPDQDCCTLFTPRHPATKARRADVLHAEEALPVGEIVDQAVGAAVVEHFEFPVIE